MKSLWPPIGIIKRRLFAPSDQLIHDWIKHPSNLEADLARQLENDALANEKKDAYIATEAAGGLENLDDEDIEILEMPDHLASVFERRLAAKQAAFDNETISGQIRMIERSVETKRLTGVNRDTPLVALLVELSDEPNVWSGYAVSPETDYASDWDLLLEAHIDEPFDPLAGMIQVWNPVNIYLPSTSRVLAQLSADRLEAVRALVHEYMSGDQSDPTEAEPGVVYTRWLDDHRLLTGTPLGGEDDPRVEYQDLYRAAFKSIWDEMARQYSLMDQDRAISTEHADQTKQQPTPRQPQDPLRARIRDRAPTKQPFAVIQLDEEGDGKCQVEDRPDNRKHLLRFVVGEIGEKPSELFTPFTEIVRLAAANSGEEYELPDPERALESPDGRFRIRVTAKEGKIEVAVQALGFAVDEFANKRIGFVSPPTEKDQDPNAD